MFSAEDIIELEKKWLKYKIKQKIIFYILFFSIIIVVSFAIYSYLFQENIFKSSFAAKPFIKKIEQPILESKIKNPIVKTEVIKLENNESLVIKKNEVPIQLIIDKNITKKINNNVEENILTKKEIKPYFFKLQPTDQGSELFSSNGFLVFNFPIKIKKELKEKNIDSIREIEKIKEKIVKKKKKTNISIDMQEIDTIKYLKEKYYSTSSIVFALMLAEEYYDKRKYKKSLTWALTANDINAQDTKSWYWFAKSKVKLNQKNDAIRALKAYLSHNKSKTLSTLLNKIQHGDTND